MEYIDIKGLNKKASKLVMGTAWFSQDLKEEIFAILDDYIEQGGNVIDCGRYYGAGQSELILKEYLDARGNRDDLIIIDKCSHPIITPNGQHHSDYWRVKPDLITEDLHYSLYHVGVDYFDIYLMHRDDESVSVASLMDRLEQHHSEGLIKAYGVSNWSLERVQEAYEYTQKMNYKGFAVNNPSYSLAHVEKPRWVGTIYADDAYAQWHKNTDLTLISWAAQAHGFFADIYPKDGSAPQDIQDAFFSEGNFERLARAQELGEKYNVDSINIALAYVMCQDLNLGVVIGSRNTDEFHSSIRTLDIKLTPAELAYLDLKADSYQ